MRQNREAGARIQVSRGSYGYGQFSSDFSISFDSESDGQLPFIDGQLLYEPTVRAGRALGSRLRPETFIVFGCFYLKLTKIGFIITWSLLS